MQADRVACTCTNNSWETKAGGVPWGSGWPGTSSGLSKSGLQNKNLSKKLKPKLKQNTVQKIIINRRTYWYLSIEEVNQVKLGTTYTYLVICKQKVIKYWLFINSGKCKDSFYLWKAREALFALSKIWELLCVSL